MSLLAAAALGLGLGARHALEADHLAAVCTFVTADRGVGRAVRSGALWGAGHSAVIVLGGGALVLTGLSVPAPIASALDAAVAVMLVALGLASLLSMRRAAPPGPPGPPRRSLAVGMMHGASGTAALTLLVATTIPVRTDALAFVAVFGLASILGMTLAAALVAWPLASAVRRTPSIGTAARAIAGAASIAAGVVVGWSTALAA